MLAPENIQKNLNFLKNLARQKGWQINHHLVDQALKKPHPRFLYFPLLGPKGEKLFFKSCLFGRIKLRQRIIKEYHLQKWLEEKNGPVKKINDSGQKGPIFWYTNFDVPLKEGIICQEEDVSPLKLKDISRLAAQIRWLWQIKKEEIPPDLLSLILPKTKNNRVFPQAYQKIRYKYLKILRGAFEIKELDWQKQDEEKTIAFFESLKKEILAFENQEGILVHGDLSPNNIFFSPQKIILFDWESSWWSRNLILDLGIDLANFHTRCWQRPQLGEKLLKEMEKSPWAKKPFYPRALKIAFVISALQKLSPMFKFGVYQKTLDQKHFNWLVKILRKNL